MTDETKTPASPPAPREPTARQRKREDEIAVVRAGLAEQSAVAAKVRQEGYAPRRIARREFDADGKPKSNPRLHRADSTPRKATTPRPAK